MGGWEEEEEDDDYDSDETMMSDSTSNHLRFSEDRTQARCRLQRFLGSLLQLFSGGTFLENQRHSVITLASVVIANPKIVDPTLRGLCEDYINACILDYPDTYFLEPRDDNEPRCVVLVISECDFVEEECSRFLRTRTIFRHDDALTTANGSTVDALVFPTAHFTSAKPYVEMKETFHRYSQSCEQALKKLCALRSNRAAITYGGCVVLTCARDAANFPADLAKRLMRATRASFLYRRVSPPEDALLHIQVASEEEARKLAQELHSATHLGGQALWKLFSDRYSHKAGRRLCIEVAQSCPQCQLGSDYGHRLRTTGSIQSSGPWDTLSVDIVGPLPADRRHEFLIVFVDCYSRYTIQVPASNHRRTR